MSAVAGWLLADLAKVEILQDVAEDMDWVGVFEFDAVDLSFDEGGIEGALKVP